MSLGLSGKFVDMAGTHPECEPGSRTSVAKFSFLSVGPKTVQPSNCLKIQPIAIFLLLTVIVLVHP